MLTASVYTVGELRSRRRLPSRVGDTEIEWQDDDQPPNRVGSKITLPLVQRDSRFALLQGGKQFAFNMRTTPGASTWDNHRTITVLGGMDESPFLAQIKLEAWEALIGKGEAAFYRCFIPGAIAKRATELRVAPGRQGDIYYLNVPEDMSAINKRERRIRGRWNQGPTVETVQQRPILGTRHQLTGELFVPRFDPGIYVRGLLEAPDHAPRQLEPGVHLAQRSRHLVVDQVGLASLRLVD